MRFSINSCARAALVLMCALVIGGVSRDAAGQGFGACCLPDDSCETTSETECGQIGGSFQGEFTDCGDCSSLEACCLYDGTCSLETTNRCTFLGGTPAGAGTDCGTTNCPVMASCCFTDGTCLDLDVNDCLAQEGTPGFPGSLCTFADCPLECDPTFIGGEGAPKRAAAVSIVGTTAYVADGQVYPDLDNDAGLYVIDISNPAAPVVLGTRLEYSGATDVVASGTMVYVTNFYESIWTVGPYSIVTVVDASNPAAPVALGGLTYSWFEVVDGLDVSGDVLYAAVSTIGLQMIDVSNPAAPSILGTFNNGGANGVAVAGSVAYVTIGSAGLQVIDVSDPAAPFLLGAVDTPGIAIDVKVSGTLAFVADWNSGLQVIDVSDPMNPAIIGSFNTPGSARGVSVSGDVVCVADGSAGLHMIAVSDPTNPVSLGSRDTPVNARDVVVVDDVAYVADDTTGLLVYDLLRCDLGACCYDATCVDELTEADCVTLGGTFFGIGSTCAANDCTIDQCYASLPIGLGDTPFDTTGATTDGPINPGCDLGDGTLFTNDIWFEYFALDYGTLTVSTCGQAGFDTVIAAYTGDCGSLDLVACDDQGCGSQSTMSFHANAGQTYRLRVGGWNNQSGPGTLSVTLAVCGGDFTGAGSVPDGTVGIDEFLAVLGQWGCVSAPLQRMPACQADVTGPGGTPPDGTVGIEDFLYVLSNWGPCF